MDLHENQSNIWYMHIIDEFTRLSNAVIIRSKTVAVKTFLKHWMSLFGVPRKIFSDNGGEFIGDEFYDMCESFNIKIDTTPSYSPRSNGLCERHNQTHVFKNKREHQMCHGYCISLSSKHQKHPY